MWKTPCQNRPNLYPSYNRQCSSSRQQNFTTNASIVHPVKIFTILFAHSFTHFPITYYVLFTFINAGIMRVKDIDKVPDLMEHSLETLSLFFFSFIYILFEVQLTYTLVSVSGIHQSDSYICFQIIFHYRLLQVIKYSFLCYTLDVSVIYTIIIHSSLYMLI